MYPLRRFTAMLCLGALLAGCTAATPGTERSLSRRLLDSCSKPPEAYRDVYGEYRSPLLFYNGDSVRTAEAFVQNPCQDRWPETVYRTGDLAELSPTGELFFCGRRDALCRRRRADP